MYAEVFAECEVLPKDERPSLLTQRDNLGWGQGTKNQQ